MAFTKKDWIVLSHFRRDARLRLTALSRTTGIPVSTLFDKFREYQKAIVPKSISLLNFQALGFHSRANLLIRAGIERDKLRNHLVRHPAVNSLYKVNNGYDFLAEGVFWTLKELEEFVEHIRLTLDVRAVQVYYVVDELKREAFLSDPSYIDTLVRQAARAHVL